MGAAFALLVACGATAFFPLLALAQAGAGRANSTQAEAAKKFRRYLEEDWKKWMDDFPEMASASGFPGHGRDWTDDSPEGIEKRKKHLHESVTALTAISRDELPASERMNYDLYRELLQTAEEGLQYGDDANPFRGVVPDNLWMPMNQMGGVQQGAASTLATMPRKTVGDYEDILARLAKLPKHVEDELALLQAGVKNGYTPPRIAVRDLPKQVADLIPADPMKSALLQAFHEFPADFPQSQKPRLIEKAQKIYMSAIEPAFQKLHDYLEQTYLPACRGDIAATSLPNGAAAYQFHIRWQTTTSLTPQQIHATGLAEVKRIRAEMDKVIAASGFKGTFHEFTEFLRNDPQFYYGEADDLVNGYRIIVKKIDPELAHEFGKLPRLPYGVCVVPEFKAPSQTTAYYEPGSPRAGRAGCYYVNTYNLRARPKWEMEALSLHESVPGHHLQIAVAQEQENVPEFRRHVGYSAFVEGWALYGESLGEALGMYKDRYSKFGQLSYEMWRAVRLVVDTGMHSMGWTRDQAIQFVKDNTGKTDQDITVEVDRYIVWPGQALAYKLGQLKIRELRTDAEKKLGPKFDARKFHDAVLENGAMPLNMLEAHVKEWIAAQ
jgi:uncharacterized protein (DUF885 family)